MCNLLNRTITESVLLNGKILKRLLKKTTLTLSFGRVYDKPAALISQKQNVTESLGPQDDADWANKDKASCQKLVKVKT